MLSCTSWGNCSKTGCSWLMPRSLSAVMVGLAHVAMTGRPNHAIDVAGTAAAPQGAVMGSNPEASVPVPVSTIGDTSEVSVTCGGFDSMPGRLVCPDDAWRSARGTRGSGRAAFAGSTIGTDDRTETGPCVPVTVSSEPSEEQVRMVVGWQRCWQADLSRSGAGRASRRSVAWRAEAPSRCKAQGPHVRSIELN